MHLDQNKKGPVLTQNKCVYVKRGEKGETLIKSREVTQITFNVNINAKSTGCSARTYNPDTNTRVQPQTQAHKHTRAHTALFLFYVTLHKSKGAAPKKIINLVYLRPPCLLIQVKFHSKKIKQQNISTTKSIYIF